jgi:DeoR/GlpR family transcriptional regulator of sugar metabolism
LLFGKRDSQSVIMDAVKPERMEETVAVSMFAEERLLRIVELVNRRGKCTVAELTDALGVSPVTVRRDLERLEEKKLLLRTHGGAMVWQDSLWEGAHERSFSEKKEEFAEEKEKIAEAAAALVQEGEAVLLTPGTTNTLLAAKLARRKGLTIVTNASNLVSHLGGQTDNEFILIGGNLRPKSYALVGPLAEQALSNLRVDKLFLGVDGLDIEHGLTTPNLAEASVNRRMMAVAKMVIVVADHSKFRRVTFSHIAPLKEVHAIVTDRQPSAAETNKIREFGISLILA